MFNLIETISSYLPSVKVLVIICLGLASLMLIGAFSIGPQESTSEAEELANFIEFIRNQ